ncbi:hypothetical protein PHJA_002865800 [Phtheirospermum japonicum]|uniref:Uncharacterized protein n=1 Tax=Phtheirospermum japonicum TaxID=374723 RepID=A0A830D697_9LAMI|nr:hypothetical protein PHJA_002865800 [Phtheirospermum japonicum]
MDIRDKHAAVDRRCSPKVVAPPPKAAERKPTEDINECAEQFIRKFRQQLLLQRLESIENYEQMLKSGSY